MSTPKTKQVKVIYQTPAFRLSYPALFTPQPTLNDKPGAPDVKYSITMNFPKSTTAAALKSAKHPASNWMPTDDLKAFYGEIVKCAKANFGPDVDLNSLKLVKFRNGDAPKTNGSVDENAKGFVVIRSSSKEMPKCLRQDKTVITMENAGEIYAGCWARAILTIAPFVKPERGVTVYLAGVQKLADDGAFSSRPRVEDEFDAVAAEGASNDAAGAGTQEKMPWDN